MDARARHAQRSHAEELGQVSQDPGQQARRGAGHCSSPAAPAAHPQCWAEASSSRGRSRTRCSRGAPGSSRGWAAAGLSPGACAAVGQGTGVPRPQALQGCVPVPGGAPSLSEPRPHPRPVPVPYLAGQVEAGEVQGGLGVPRAGAEPHLGGQRPGSAGTQPPPPAPPVSRWRRLTLSGGCRRRQPGPRVSACSWQVSASTCTSAADRLGKSPVRLAKSVTGGGGGGEGLSRGRARPRPRPGPPPFPPALTEPHEVGPRAAQAELVGQRGQAAAGRPVADLGQHLGHGVHAQRHILRGGGVTRGPGPRSPPRSPPGARPAPTCSAAPHTKAPVSATTCATRAISARPMALAATRSAAAARHAGRCSPPPAAR